jgi:hypothetical protein
MPEAVRAFLSTKQFLLETGSGNTSQSTLSDIEMETEISEAEAQVKALRTATHLGTRIDWGKGGIATNYFDLLLLHNTI